MGPDKFAFRHFNHLYTSAIVDSITIIFKKKTKTLFFKKKNRQFNKNFASKINNVSIVSRF